MELRKFHVSLLKKGFGFYEESAEGTHINEFPSIRYSEAPHNQFTGTAYKHYHQITSILEFIHLVNNTSP
jgi:hypothetical protein